VCVRHCVGEVYLAADCLLLMIYCRGVIEARITSAVVLSSITYRKESSVDRSILSFIC
jgi:hypothetical protein